MREFGRELKRKYNTDIVPRKGTILRSMPPFPNTLLQRELNTERRTKRDDKSSNQARASSSRPSTSSVITSSAYKRLLAKEQREANQSRTSGLIKACEPYHYRNETHRRNMQEIEVLLASDLGPRLTVVNNVDDEGLPVKFQYINDIWMNDKDMEQFGFGVMIGRCSTAEDSKCGCLRSSDGKFGYNSNGRLRIDQGSAIYECSSKCGCSIQCTNRVVQRGRTVELQLFKTKDRGWGIRTMEDLPAGTYIERYLGEVITNEEAERRGRVYDDAGRTYLFDLDWHGDDTCQYVIDAYPCGNFTRFFNHSCNPNLMVIPVFINTWEATLHQLAFFTRRAIRKFEELTFDYMGGIPIDSDDDDDDDEREGPLSRDNNAESVSAGKKPRASKYPCLCGSRHCRKFVHF
ncbi:hypothetical protein BDF22DRAFT_670863 [Syncephalis plumigaleata]|nr:hypothetical protein BDF22DRAFT_670863 [Syncephalis plumigaleata]